MPFTPWVPTIFPIIVLSPWLTSVFFDIDIVLMAIESACIPLPSEIIMPFAGYLVSTGRFDLYLAATAGAIDADAVYALIRGDVQVDDEGTVSGVEEAITALHQQKPHLFTTIPRGTRDASAGGHTPRPADDPIREFTRGLLAAAKAQN